MAKKTTKEVAKEAAQKVEEEESSNDAGEEQEEEEQEETDSEEADDQEEAEGEEEEEEAKEQARPAADDRRSARRRERERARANTHEDEGHGDDEEAADGEDPYWWTPHAVMSALVLIGVLGFFGAFNKLLGGIAAKPAGAPEKPVAAQEATPPPQPVKPPMPPMPGADQQREMFGAKHLLVMYKGSRRAPETITRSKDEAKARATEAMKKAKDSKNKFEDLVKEYSDEPNAGARGGDLGKFPKGAMVPEFQNALDKMKVNDISDIVETPFGYHVILRTQ